MAVGKRVSEKRRLLGLSQKELGQKVGMSQQAIDRIEQGQTRMPRRILELAQALNSSPEFLINGTSPDVNSHPKFGQLEGANNNSLSVIEPSLTQAFHPKKDLPVLGRAQGGPDGNLTMGNDAIDWTYRPADLAGVNDAFAVYVTGDSMHPKYEDGDLLYIHPNRPIRRGRYVLLETTSHKGFIKKFIRWDGDTLEVEQFNPQGILRFHRTEILRIMLVIGSMDG